MYRHDGAQVIIVAVGSFSFLFLKTRAGIMVFGRKVFELRAEEEMWTENKLYSVYFCVFACVCICIFVCFYVFVCLCMR